MKNGYLLFCLLLSACTSSTKQDSLESTNAAAKGVLFKRSDYGSEWPFKTIDQGEVHCIDGLYVVFFAKNGPIYTLNGAASQMVSSGERDWKKLDGEQIVGKSIGPMLDAGLKLCQ